MTESVKKEPSKKLTLRKRTVETYVSCAVRGIMNTKARLRQKKEKFIRSVPWLNKIDRKCRAFDLRMERKYGQVYTKLRDSTKNIARTVLAAKLFGVPGVIGMCAYKTCEKALSLLEPAQQAKQNGEISKLSEYFTQNKGEAGFTMTSGSISIAMTACDVTGNYAAKGALRVGKASLLISPEVKKLAQTTGKWFKGEESFEEVRRDAAVLGITFGTYFVSDVPMTHGSGKPTTAIPLASAKDEGKKSAHEKIKKYFRQVAKLFAAGIPNPGGMVTASPINLANDKAPESEPKAAKPEKNKTSDYKNEVNKLFAAGVGNPGGMITMYDIKNRKTR